MKNIVDIIEKYIGRNKIRQKNIKMAKISDSQISKFLNRNAGLDGFQTTRMFLALGFKIYDSENNLLLGENPEQEIEQNYPPAQL